MPNHDLILEAFIKDTLPKLPDKLVPRVTKWLKKVLIPDTLAFLEDFLNEYNMASGSINRYADDNGISRQAVSQRVQRIRKRLKKQWSNAKSWEDML